MDVQESMPRDFQKCGREDLAVRHDDPNVRPRLGHLLEKLGIANFRRLQKRQQQFARANRDGRRLHLHPAAGRFVRLGDDDHDVVFAREHVERGDGKVGSAEECDSQDTPQFIPRADAGSPAPPLLRAP